MKNATPVRVPLWSLLVVALAACSGQGTPPPDVAKREPVAAEPAPPATPAPTPQPTPAPVPDAPPAGSGLAHWDGYGDMRLGMTAEQARAAWQGELKGVPAEGESCFHLSPASAKVPAELAFMFEGGKFVRYSTQDAALTAPGGGRIGMTVDEIKALYAGRVEEQPHKYETGGKYLRIKDAGTGSVLILETSAAGKVDEWRVGVTPQVDYVEGCS